MSVKNERFAFVPIDAEGIEACEYMDYDSGHVATFELTDAEFMGLYEAGVINRINDETNLLIDDYEEERIPKESLPICNRIVNEEGVYKDGMFARAIRTAINHGTFVDLCF